MGKGKRVRRQVQYFQPGQDIEASNFDGDEEYQGDDGPAGSDNEYQGATHFYNLRISPGLCGRLKSPTESDTVLYPIQPLSSGDVKGLVLDIRWEVIYSIHY